MSLTLTLILMAITTPLIFYAGWRGAQLPNVSKGPRMIPWRFVMLISAALDVLLLVHLARLAAGAE